MSQYWADIAAMLDFYPALKYSILFFTGLCLGSFTSAVAWRAPRGLPWAYERVPGAGGAFSPSGWRAIRSICPACGHVLGARDLVPVLSWALSGARCRYCQSPIPVRYPVFELACAAAAMALGATCAHFGIGYTGLALLLMMMPFAVALGLSAVSHRKLPAKLLAVLAVLGALFFSCGL